MQFVKNVKKARKKFSVVDRLAFPANARKRNNRFRV